MKSAATTEEPKMTTIRISFPQRFALSGDTINNDGTASFETAATVDAQGAARYFSPTTECWLEIGAGYYEVVA